MTNSEPKNHCQFMLSLLRIKEDFKGDRRGAASEIHTYG
jgi:hypothetical protein